jgi:thiamine biosynthesis lipoprotein
MIGVFIRTRLAVSLLILLAFISCNDKQKIWHLQGTGIGTQYSLIYTGNEIQNLQNELDSLISAFSKEFSVFDSTSLISQINRNELITLSPSVQTILEKSIEISEITNGAFDVTVAPLVDYWGFIHKKDTHHCQDQIDSILQFCGYKKLCLDGNRLIKQDMRMQLNFNAIAKGRLVDILSQYVENKGTENYIMEIGGEVYAKGTKNGKLWQVGIQIPTDEKDGAIEANHLFPLQNQAVATSGNYRNYFEEGGIRYSHIINPKTGYSEKSNLLSVSVVAENCMTADALATAFMVMGLKTSVLFLETHPEYAAYFIYHEAGIYRFKAVNAEENKSFYN